jgi:branched-chain amino acid transport system substrate-binding protein
MKRFRLFWVILFVSSLIIGAAGLEASAKETIKIAFLGPLSGPNAEMGLAARNAFDLAIKQANESGEFKYVIEPMVLDDESSPATGVAAALKATSDPLVVAATGHFNSPVALATIHTFHAFHVPMVLWGTIHPDITNRYNYPEITRVAPTLETQSQVGAQFAITKMGYKNWAIIHDTTDFGMACKTIFSKFIESLGGRLLAVDGIPTGTTDFRPILTRIKGLNEVNAIFLGGVTTEAGLVKNQMAKLDMNNMIMIGNTGIFSETFNNIAGEAAEGTLCTGYISAEATEEGRRLLEGYKKAGYKESFNEITSTGAYDATNIILDALKQVGPDDKVALAKAIRATKHQGSLGETVFDEKGQTKYGGLRIYVSQDGNWTEWDKSEYATGERKLPAK